jgi:hypothetical protein
VKNCRFFPLLAIFFCESERFFAADEKISSLRQFVALVPL